MNQYFSEFVRRVDNRFAVDSVEMSLGDWICENTKLRGRKFSFDRYPFQKQIADDLHPNLDCIKPSQVGLALALETPVPTPEGWSTMGDLKVGDLVFDEKGLPARVLYVSPIYTDHECYEVEFDTGEVIVADAAHRWVIEPEVVVRTEDLSTGSSIVNGHGRTQWRHTVTRVSPTTSVPVRCISVDSESHLFLAGLGMIPTHNTEVQIRKSLGFVARNRGTSLIFTLPNDDMFERVSKARILPLVRENDVFNLGDEKQTRSKELIQIGQSFVYVTGAKESDATSISADVVMNDEIDLTNQQMLSLFNSRLQNSDWKINQRFSTPTYYGFGVDAGFQRSDQHEYMIKCHCCNHWNIPLFTPAFINIPGLPESMGLEEIDEQLIDTGRIKIDDAEVVCEKCRTPLDLADHENREWVPRFESRTHHRGYRVSPFSTDRLPPSYIITQLFRYRRLDYMRGWHNTVLGLPFTPGNARLSDADILPCFTPERNEPTPYDRSAPTWIGIDVGQRCHIIVAQGHSLENLKTVLWKVVPIDDLNDEIEVILSRYNVIGGACDRHPYTPNAEALRDLSGGKILPVEYRGQKDVNLVKDQLTEEIIHGQVNRTTMIDLFVKAVRKQRISFLGYGEHRAEILEHLKDMVRDEKPEEPAKWIKMTGNDHFFHAGAFLAAALKMKELEIGLFSELRSTIHVAGVEMQGTNDTIRDIVKPRKTRAGFND